MPTARLDDRAIVSVSGPDSEQFLQNIVTADLDALRPGEAKPSALLHDAPEYVIGDMISPFKSAVGGGDKAVEQRLQRAINLRFGLPADTTETLRRVIKRADQVAAYFEATQLAGFSVAEAAQFFGRPRGISADRFDLGCKPARTVQAAFLKRFAAIEKLRG